MDYILARWFTIKDLPPQRLKQLHAFENAVAAYSAKLASTKNTAKIFMPLWWQEGALFLSKEFKKFWEETNRNPSEVSTFKETAAAILAANGFKVEASVFNDIVFMHKCDLAIYASFHASTNLAAPQQASSSYIAAF